MFATRPGIMSLLKDGGKHFSGLEEATLRNIDACRKLAEITRTSLGPNGMNKLIVNHIEKLFVTSDAATIVKQLEVQHPAAKLVAMACEMQEQEFGDATNLVISFAGELLHHAEQLLRQGLHCADIIQGYELALDKALELLEQRVCYKVENVRDVNGLRNAVATSIAPKSNGFESHLAGLIAEAAVMVMPSNPASLNLDNIRIAKISGASLQQSFLVQGMVVTRPAGGTVRRAEKCKALVLGCGLEMGTTETKGTVLINTAEQLLNFSKGEEARMEAQIRELKDAGIGAIIVGGVIADIAQHFCNKYEILTLKCQSKYELQRICRTLGAVTSVTLTLPPAEDLGYADDIHVEEISSKEVTVIKARDSRVATIVLRAATSNILDEAERAVDDGIHCVKNVTRDNRFVAGGGACEVELGQQIRAYGNTVTGLGQYSVVRYGEALDCVARILADTAGLNSTEILTQLYAAHASGAASAGVNIYGSSSERGVVNVLDMDPMIVDHYKTKETALKLATDAALTVLRVDQLIMARPAGGPKPPQQGGDWDQD